MTIPPLLALARPANADRGPKDKFADGRDIAAIGKHTASGGHDDVRTDVVLDLDQRHAFQRLGDRVENRQRFDIRAANNLNR